MPRAAVAERVSTDAVAMLQPEAERDSLASQLQQARGEVQQAVADRAAVELRAAQLQEATSKIGARGLRAKINDIHPTHAVVTRGIWTWCAKCAAATTGLHYKLPEDDISLRTTPRRQTFAYDTASPSPMPSPPPANAAQKSRRATRAWNIYVKDACAHARMW